MFEHMFLLYCHIFMNKNSRNTISDRQLFSWYRSKCFIEDFLIRRTGSIFESLVQCSGGCMYLLQGC